jgi:hypothetical protein
MAVFLLPERDNTVKNYFKLFSHRKNYICQIRKEHSLKPLKKLCTKKKILKFTNQKISIKKNLNI